MKLRFTLDKNYDRRFCGSKKELRDLDAYYRRNLRYMEYSRKEYQRSWNAISAEFSRYVERVTGYTWFYKEYTCVVSAKVPGVSNWGTAPLIARGWKENPFTQRRITAHELILSHYFEIHNRHFQDSGLKDGQVWGLAEIAAFALTSLTDEARKFWPWDIKGYYTDHDYPQLVDLQLKMRTAFLKRKNFDDYVRKGVRQVRRYPDLHP